MVNGSVYLNANDCNKVDRIKYSLHRKIIYSHFSLERQPVLEPKHWYHKLAVKRKDTYRRLALDGLGSSNLISEHAIVRAHDRAQPLLVKMFMSSNYGKRSFNPTETKVRRVFNRDGLDRRYRYRISNSTIRRQLADPYIII